MSACGTHAICFTIFFGIRLIFFYSRTLNLGQTSARLPRDYRPSTKPILSISLIQFLLCITAFKSFFHTGRAALSTVYTTFSISSHKCVFCGASIPLMRRIIPGYQKLGQNVTTDIIHESIEVTSRPGALSHFIGFSLVRFWASLNVLSHHVVT